MKKLTKLNINPEKVMKSDELVKLRGGYGPDCGSGWTSYHCQIYYCDGCNVYYGYACVPTSEADPNEYVRSELGAVQALCYLGL